METIRVNFRKIKLLLSSGSKQKKYLLLGLFLIILLQGSVSFLLLHQIKSEKPVYKETFSAVNGTTSEESFCFAHISDAHADYYQDNLTAAILYFNNILKPSFIIDTGDTVSNDSGQQNFSLYRQWAELSRSKIYAVPGNHDYQGGINFFINYFGDTKAVFDYNGYRFIGFDSNEKIDYSWIKSQLRGKEGKGILFSHMPVSFPDNITHGPPMMSPTDQTEIKKIMVEYQVLAFLSGHLHEPFSYPTVFQLENTAGKILDIGAPSLGHKNAYQLICLDNGVISNYFVNINGWLPITPTPASSLPRTSITFQQGTNGYSGVKDTNLSLYKDTIACTSNSSKVGYKQQSATLTYFDLFSLPPGATIEKAKLSFYAIGWANSNTNLGVYKVLRNWVDCQATYYKPKTGTVWGTDGCNNTLTDREAFPLSFIKTSNINQWYDFDITEAVQEWVNNPSVNKGVLLKQVFADDLSSFYFATSESKNYAPKLTITYYFSNPIISGEPSPTSNQTPSITPTPTPEAHFSSPDCSSACGSDIYLFSNESSSGRVGLNNQYSYFVFFVPPADARLKELEVLVGQSNVAPRSATCKIIDAAGDLTATEKSTPSFSTGAAWQKISFAALPFDQRPLLRTGQAYRLFCRGPDSWNSIYWKGGSLNSDPRAAKVLASSCCGQSPVPTFLPLSPTPTSELIIPTLAPTFGPTLIPTLRPTSTPTRTPAVATTTPSLGTISLTLQQGLNNYSGTIDTYFYQYQPDSQYCSSNQLKAGYNMQNSSLVRFDLSPLPQEAIVESAKLSLYASGWGGTNISLGVYQILVDWDCQATWNKAIGVNWSLPGCNGINTDRRDTPAATINTNGISRWYDFDLTSLVQSWINNPSSNKGVLLKQTDSVKSTFYFNSSENSANQPKLTITYR